MIKKLFILCLLLSAAVFPGIVSAEPGNNPADRYKVKAGIAVKTPLAIKALILPKFEIGELYGDFPGEAQNFYEAYFKDATVYEIKGDTQGSKVYVNGEGIALCLTGMGKVGSALTTTYLLNDDRFDFSKAYILSVGCAGSAIGYATIGDVIISSATVDFDLGHRVDSTELTEKGKAVTWFKLEDIGICVHILNPALVKRVYDLTENAELGTTPQTKAVLAKNFPGEVWANREPKVLLGTTVTGDNYWKGKAGHNNALAQCLEYKCPDPFAVTEMEDHAIAGAVKRAGLFDRFIAIRASVNTDVFMNKDTPETLWQEGFMEIVEKDDSAELGDIFPVAMKNCFAVGKIIIESILDGTIK